MFEIAVEAAITAAARWTPEDLEPGGDSGCCPLCFRRYRVLVLEGPLRALPHAVTHVAVDAVDERIRARVEASPPLRPAIDGSDRTRQAAAAGGLLVVALEELGTAGPRLDALRRRFTEPAVSRYLEQHRSDDEAWLDG